MSPRVLFVDDDRNILSAYERGLRKHYTITTACGGEEGLAALAEHGPFAVVVSDRHMPGMDGIRFLAEVLAGRLFLPRPDPRFAESTLVRAAQLHVGMILKTEVIDLQGHIHIAAWHELTEALIERLGNDVRLGTIREPIAVIDVRGT